MHFRVCHPLRNLLLALTLSASSFAADARLEPLARLIADDAPQVRLAALRFLGKIPSADAADIALRVLDKPMDPTLDYALWLTLNELAEPWIIAIEQGEWNPDGREKQLEFGLRAVPPAQASRVLGKILETRPLTPQAPGPWIELIGAAGTPHELSILLDLLLKNHFEPSAARRALQALQNAQRLRKLQPAGGISGYGQLLTHADPQVQLETTRLAAQWKELGQHFPRLVQIALAPETTPELRAAAIDSLRQTGGPEAIGALESLAGSANSPAIQSSAITALASLDLPRSIPSAIKVLQSLDNENDALEFWRTLLRVRDVGPAITRAVDGIKLNETVARAGMRVARDGGRNDLNLATALATAADLSIDSAQLSATLIAELAAKTQAQGNPDRGEWIYRRNALACVICHAVGGAGGKVGPDLTSIGASAPMDYIIESIILPSVKIKEGYHAVLVTTQDEIEYSGTLASETQDELKLRNAVGDILTIAKADIANRDQGVLSMMPTGLIDTLNEQEQLDLYAFLSQLGKAGPFDGSQQGVARRWHIGSVIHTELQNDQADWVWTVPFTSNRWISTFSRVNGMLTKEVFEENARSQFWVSRLALYAGTEIEVERDGPVDLGLAADAPVELWINGRNIGSTGTSRLNLSAGRHRVLLKIDPKQIPTRLRLSSATARFIMD